MAYPEELDVGERVEVAPFNKQATLLRLDAPRGDQFSNAQIQYDNGVSANVECRLLTLIEEGHGG